MKSGWPLSYSPRHDRLTEVGLIERRWCFWKLQVGREVDVMSSAVRGKVTVKSGRGTRSGLLRGQQRASASVRLTKQSDLQIGAQWCNEWAQVSCCVFIQYTHMYRCSELTSLKPTEAILRTKCRSKLFHTSQYEFNHWLLVEPGEPLEGRTFVLHWKKHNLNIKS